MERGSAVVVRRVAAAVAIATASIGPAIASGGESGPDRRDRGGTAEMPKRPTGGAGELARKDAARGIVHRPGALLAGRPSQRLRVGVRVGRRAARSDGLRIELRSVRRADPRHRGRTVGGGVEASARPTRIAGSRARFRLEGLGPAPGRHRLVVRASGRRIAAKRIDVLPQSRTPLRERGARRPRPTARSSGGRQTLALAVGELNHDLSFTPGSEAGTALAVEGDDPDRAVAVTGDGGGPPVAFVSNRGFAAGSNARRTIATVATLPGGGSAGLAICCDAAAAADAQGSLWVAARSLTGSGRIVLDRVPPGSTGFQGTSTALPRAPGSSAQEKPALAVADGDRIAAGWIETLGGAQNVVVSECDISTGAGACDDPDAWSQPAAITASSGLYSMPALDYAPNGDLYAVWWDAGPLPQGNRIALDRCRDGEDCTSGASWNDDSLVADLDAHDDDGQGGPEPLPLFCPIIGAPGGLVNPSPSVEIGPGGEVYVAWSDLRDNADPGGPSRCTASGSDKTFDSFVAAGPAPDSIPASNSGVRLSADSPLAINDHFLPSLSVDPSSGVLEASFYSTADDPGGQHASRDYVLSIDGGSTFTPPVALSGADSRFSGPLSDGFDYGERQGSDSAAGVYRPAWTDNRPLQGRDADLYVLSPPVETRIDAGPSGRVPSATSTFRFSTPAPRAVCSASGTFFAACTSPRQVGPFRNGPQSFQVTSTDRAGNWMDPTPARRAWSVADLTPPDTLLLVEPDRRTTAKRPRYEFTSNDPTAKFQCRYDKDVWRFCLSPKTQKVAVGKHKVRIRAFDLAGNVDPTPVKDRFRRIKKCGKRKKKLGKC